MESGTESDVEDLQLLPAASSHQTTANEKETKKEESVVWLYFQKIKSSGQSGAGYRVECTECGKNVKTAKRNITNLMSHLKTKHPKKYEEVRQKTEEKQKLKERKRSNKQATKSSNNQAPQKSQTTLTGIAAKRAKLETSSTLHKKITRSIAGMMIHDFQPYSLVCDRGFKGLMQQLEPRYEIPHRTTFLRSVIPSIYEEVKQDVKSRLVLVQEEKSKVALTTDMWTSEANDAYLGLSCHFLTVDFELVSLCLTVEHFSGRHTGANIASCLKQILIDYGINHSAVSTVVADNASNMDVAVRMGEWRSRHCSGHTLQLAIDDGLKMSPGIQDMLKTAKAIVSFYNRSYKATEMLTELQGQLNLPVHKLINDCPTRWNSTFYMLQ